MGALLAHGRNSCSSCRDDEASFIKFVCGRERSDDLKMHLHPSLYLLFFPMNCHNSSFELWAWSCCCSTSGALFFAVPSFGGECSARRCGVHDETRNSEQQLKEVRLGSASHGSNVRYSNGTTAKRASALAPYANEIHLLYEVATSLRKRGKPNKMMWL